jgi:hypothetical protein
VSGVYVMGGEFGSKPRYVGPLASIITPVDSTLVFERPPAQSATGAIVSDPTIRPFLAPEIPATFSTSLPIDFQGNGRPDLFACYVSNPPLPKVKVPCRVLRPQADGSLIDITHQLFGAQLPSAEAPREIVVADFNGDGRPDIFIANHGWDADPFAGETNTLLISNADGTYTDRSSTLPQTADFSHSACVGDINGDGKLDIYVGNISGSAKIAPYFLMGKGDGTFTQKKTGLPSRMISLEEKFLSCLFVDADQDGFPDLVLGTHGDGGYVDNIILFNDGTGDFTKRPRYVLPVGPLGNADSLSIDIMSLDINRDGRPDLLVLSTNKSSASGFGLQALINQGNGTFADETAARIGPQASRTTGRDCGFMRIADFNGDGWEDLYCSNGPSDVPNRYWLNSGEGSWRPAPPGLPQGRDFGVHAVDFDGDGRPDLLQVSHTSSGDVAYDSFLNRTQRMVPSEPIMGAAIAGDAQVTLNFAAPLGAGASPITGYVATCRTGAAGGVVTASGNAAPITVAGLVNGRWYSCSVAATSARGDSLPSAEVRVSPNS